MGTKQSRQTDTTDEQSETDRQSLDPTPKGISNLLVSITQSISEAMKPQVVHSLRTGFVD